MTGPEGLPSTKNSGLLNILQQSVCFRRLRAKLHLTLARRWSNLWDTWKDWKDEAENDYRVGLCWIVKLLEVSILGKNKKMQQPNHQISGSTLRCRLWDCASWCSVCAWSERELCARSAKRRWSCCFHPIHHYRLMKSSRISLRTRPAILPF